MSTLVPTTRPPGDGWLEWINPHRISRPEPYDYTEVEVWRRGDQSTTLLDPHRMRPETNVAGLYWRPAGPSLTEECQAQCGCPEVDALVVLRKSMGGLGTQAGLNNPLDFQKSVDFRSE
jgi:hypothetical protein